MRIAAAFRVGLVLCVSGLAPRRRRTRPTKHDRRTLA